jgi:hypothetical protein
MSRPADPEAVYKEDLKEDLPEQEPEKQDPPLASTYSLIPKEKRLPGEVPADATTTAEQEPSATKEWKEAAAAEDKPKFVPPANTTKAKPNPRELVINGWYVSGPYHDKKNQWFYYVKNPKNTRESYTYMLDKKIFDELIEMQTERAKFEQAGTGTTGKKKDPAKSDSNSKKEGKSDEDDIPRRGELWNPENIYEPAIRPMPKKGTKPLLERVIREIDQQTGQVFEIGKLVIHMINQWVKVDADEFMAMVQKLDDPEKFKQFYLEHLTNLLKAASGAEAIEELEDDLDVEQKKSIGLEIALARMESDRNKLGRMLGIAQRSMCAEDNRNFTMRLITDKIAGTEEFRRGVGEIPEGYEPPEARRRYR